MHQDKLFQRILYLLISLFFCAIGVTFMIQSNLGMAPWDVLYTGLTRYIDFSYGDILKFACILWVAISYFLGIKPSIATIIDTCFFGSFVDFSMQIIKFPVSDNLFISLLFFILGLLIWGTGIGIYLNTNLGAGPHIALVLGIKNKLKASLGTVKTISDLFVLLIGIFIGGMFGIGTILNALLTGYIIQVSTAKICLPGIPKKQVA